MQLIINKHFRGDNFDLQMEIDKYFVNQRINIWLEMQKPP